MSRMRNDRLALVLLIGLTGCRDGVGAGNGATAGPPIAAPAGQPAQTATLIGLYEGGEGPRRNQMCMLQREGGPATFGIVTWSSGETNCSGVGRATRDGDRLRLAMEGDESCQIDARMEGRRVTLPDRLPSGCAYYCGPNARLSGAAFDKTGGSEQDAMRAVDLVGDPLCGG